MRLKPYTRRNLTHNKKREDGSNWRSGAHDSKKIPQAMRNMKNSIIEEPLIHLIIWIRNDDVMNEEYDDAEGSRRSLPMKQIKEKYSIVISWYCFVIHLIIFSWCVMHDRLVALMTVMRYGWMLCWLNNCMMHKNLSLCICFMK